MSTFPDFSAVIFDLDGLIIDTEPTYFAAWEYALETMGYANAREFCHTLTGMAYSAITAKILVTYGDDFDLDYFAELSSQSWEREIAANGITIQPGFQALIGLLRQLNVPYCVATNSLGAKARRNLALAGLAEVFSIVIARDQVRQGKPDPEIYLKAAQAVGCDIRTCLVLEDSYPGILAAYRAGALVAYIPSNAPEEQATALASWQFDDLCQLTEIIQAKFSAKKNPPV